MTPKRTQTAEVTEEAILFGPYEHSRYGRTLEIRPSIELTRTGRFPSQAVVVTTAARRMIEMSKGGEKLNCVLVARDDEPDCADPTLHPDFREISENLRELCAKWFARAKFCLEAGPLDLADLEVRTGLYCYDKPIIRFAAGTQKTFAALTGQKPRVLKEVIDNLVHVEHSQLVIDAEFVRGDIDNSTDSELRGFVGYLNAIKPSRVELSTPNSARTIRGKKVKAITKSRMAAIQEQITEKTGLPVESVVLSGS